jgi:predicted AlkP superfamily pyrophosphatase or phosphodiesterase
MARVFIAGIDALEYSLVEKLNLRNIKQVEYGKVAVPCSKLLTPLIWASFITGTSEHGIETFTVRRNPLIRLGGSFFEKMGISSYKGPRHFLRRMSLKVGLFTSPVDKRDLQAKTIFDYAKKPVAISIPAYNEWEAIHKLRLEYPFVKIIEKHDEVKAAECIELNWRIFQEKLEQTSRKLEEGSWDLLMVHFLILDTIGHLYWNRPGKVEDAHRFMDVSIGRLLSKVEDQIVLIVSDHGMKNGVHTEYGFYSSNVKVGLVNPKITDFHDIILKELRR